MGEAFLQGLQNFGSLPFILNLFIGSVIGIVFGIIPGIGALTAIALLIPFVIKMPLIYAIPLLVSINACAVTAGSITSILLNIPGTGANVATLIDGFPMSQKGQAGRALGASLASSGMGGVISVFFAFAMIPLILPMIMGLRSADMVFLILVGISFIGILGTGSMMKGLLSGGMGLLISFIGFQSVTGAARFTFNSAYLYDGIPLVPLALGLFGLPELFKLAVAGGSISKQKVVIKGMQDVLVGIKDVFRHFGLFMRSTIIGYIVGIIPGIGASVSSFVAYGQAKQTSKYPEKFGTGIVEGVIAPESANNAVQGGAILTTLALGVPGSPETALLLGAMVLMGIIPGPQMMVQQLNVSFTFLLVVIAANVFGALICIAPAARLAKLTAIPGRLLVPLILVIVFVGGFAQRKEIIDVIMTLAFGAIGLGMDEFGFNKPALLLGYILGSLFETNLFIALAASGPLFFMRPVSLTLIALIIAIVIQGPIRSILRNRSQRRAV